ncbi:A24 family peptidase [Yersinia ruckeri]|uniref:prepilin peptidase n=1 Tax=Yersinia ruckeri TaxID=29486 RepID=UPI0020C04600|nr:A24 family peptidase [Yersinia ruckeri]HDL6787498.1 prepilin peptidase [Yersinia enterocolitica]MCW6559965.1 A24 family peptidase [Yersinia ruckeri]MCW6596000.1 A24 family peptidase [Yersinia ruckeri]UZY16840.1 A24 family peptidase [Yersinia ruckeri]HDM8387227.1 prepilin peptidase [Yersinia enterocolitica]
MTSFIMSLFGAFICAHVVYYFAFIHTEKMLQEHKFYCAEQISAKYIAQSPLPVWKYSFKFLIVFVFLFAIFVLISLINLNTTTQLAYWIFTTLNVILLITDARHMILPENYTTLLILSGLIFTLTGSSNLSLSESISGAIYPVLFILCIGSILSIIKQQPSYGMGDNFLLFGIGLWIGIDKVFQFAVISTVLALCIVCYSRKSVIPLGVPMITSGFITLLVPAPFITLSDRIFVW